MPIYEFYCRHCHTVFNFLSRTVNTTKRPPCPRCKRKLERQVSLFAMGGGGTSEEGDDMDFPVDEARMERAIESLAGEMEGIGEDDPKQAANLMRKFSKMTGLEFGGTMQEALERMEAGEDPEAVESELGNAMDSEEPFVLPEQKGGATAKGRHVRGEPRRDKTLYEM